MSGTEGSLQLNTFRTAANRFFSNLSRPGERPPGEKYYMYAACVFTGLLVADLATMNFRDLMLPTKAPPARPVRIEASNHLNRGDYENIISRDPFNADGMIPDPVGTVPGQGQPENEPVLSGLPIQLIGTLVHIDPHKSVVTVNITTANKVSSYRVGDEIEGLAKVIRVERQKVIFRNLNNNRLEYAEIKKDLAFAIGVAKPAAAPAAEIQVDGNNVSVKRSEVLKYTANLGDVLNQASAVPNFVPGSGGKINGYRLVNIAPNSIYEKLGLKRFDVIKGVNGEPVDSPAKAMELYNQLKSSNGLALQIERNGSDETLNFTISE
jgi:general secretion pathway protein C